MKNFSNEQIKLINTQLKRFEEKLTNIEAGSVDALALVIFINACHDTSSFQNNRYSALEHYPKALEAADTLQRLLNENVPCFNRAISSANTIVINNRIVHPDLCFG